ncbi:MAG: type II toxin-antitoxin system HicB family antitoxin [Desulfomonilaceae bacterium]|nr:type II toxin-antitoxin system HicB family antitoxin [Desulfomonilaceae bacterium]
MQGFEYSLREGTMRYYAYTEKTKDWWIGWLVDLPGVNAQEKTFEELMESLKIGAEDMLEFKGIPVTDELEILEVPKMMNA